MDLPKSAAPNLTCFECTTGSCPYRGNQSNGCSGMCGLGCNCWPWICGDCCIHSGCLDHDNYCARDGYRSYSCIFGVPRFFGCQSGYFLESTDLSHRRQLPIILFFLFYATFLGCLCIGIMWLQPNRLLPIFMALLLLDLFMPFWFTLIIIKLD